MNTSSRFAVAVHVLGLMAHAGEGAVKSEGIAGNVNTNPVVIRRLLCELAHAGLVISQKGATGGSWLARQPNEITLLDVYRAVEERDVFSLQRHRPNPSCRVGAGIEVVLQSVLDDANDAVESVLRNRTLEDVLSGADSVFDGLRRKAS